MRGPSIFCVWGDDKNAGLVRSRVCVCVSVSPPHSHPVPNATVLV